MTSFDKLKQEVLDRYYGWRGFIPKMFNQILENRTNYLPRKGWMFSRSEVNGDRLQVPRKNVPTLTPTPTTIPTPTATPTPTPIPFSESASIEYPGLYNKVTTQLTPDKFPYKDLAQKYFKHRNWQDISNISAGESGWKPNIVGINDISESRIVNSFDELMNILNKYNSVDIGVMQLNYNNALRNYLNDKELNPFDLINPEVNFKVAADLDLGNIPYTKPGLGNWYVARYLYGNNLP